MDRVRQLECFVAVAEEGGFNAAARQLGLSPPSITRLVSALEERLGAQLFNRTTRHVTLTEAGQRLLADATRVLGELDSIEATAAGEQTEPHGALAVTAPVLFGHKFIAPILLEYLDANPKVTARTLFVDRVVNVVEEGLDVALRIGDLPDSSMKAIRVGTVRRLTVAAPSFLKQHGPIEQPSDLAECRTIQASGMDDRQVWEFIAQGRRKTVTVRPTMRSNAIAATLDAAKAGWGVTRAISYQVADALKTGELVEILHEHEDRKLPIHLLHAAGRLTAAKIRTFIDFAAIELRKRAAELEAI
ncbi:MAG: LysR family transcriptional regulator [Pseudomonadota bacterium]